METAVHAERPRLLDARVGYRAGTAAEMSHQGPRWVSSHPPNLIGSVLQANELTAPEDGIQEVREIPCH